MQQKLRDTPNFLSRLAGLVSDPDSINDLICIQHLSWRLPDTQVAETQPSKPTVRRVHENTMEGASRGKFDGNQTVKPEIKYYLYPLESFPSFWGPESKCDHSKIYNPKHDGYIYAIQVGSLKPSDFW